MRKSLLTTLMLFVLPVLVYSQQSWIVQNPEIPSNISDAVFLNSQTGYISGDRFLLAKTTNSGVNWILKNYGIQDNNNSLFKTSINFLSNEEGFVYTGKLYYTSNGGDSWLLKSSDSMSAVSFISASDGYSSLASDAKKLRRTTNGGLAWINGFNFPRDIKYIKFINSATGFVSTQFSDSSICYKTTDGGVSFSPCLAMTGNVFLSDIKFNDNTKGYAFTSSNFYKTTDAGNSWAIFRNISGTINKNFTLDETFIGFNYYNINNGYSYQTVTTNGGANWTDKVLPARGIVMYFNSSTGSMMGNIGQVYSTTNQGTSFTNIASKFSVSASLNKVQVLSPNKAIAFSSDSPFNSLIITSNGGANWEKISINDYYFSPSFFSESVGYMIKSSNMNIIMKTTDGGYNWSNNIYTSYSISELLFENELTGYANFKPSNGSSPIPIYYKKTTNGGTTWNEIINGNYTSMGSLGFYYTKYFNLKQITSEVSLIFKRSYTASPGGVSDYYNLYRTSNSGVNWSESSIPGNPNVWCMEYVNNLIYISTSLGFYKSTNEGVSWILLSGFNGGKFKFVNDSSAYSITSDGSLYKTENTGYTWIRVLDRSFAVDFDFLDNKLGYVVGTGGYIAKTSNGGGTVGIEIQNPIFSNNYSLSQNYPNPFNPSTKINFFIPKNGIVQIKIFDMLGREVQTLFNDYKTAGEYSIDFNGGNLSSGIYFYKMITNDFVETKKMILIK